MSRKQPEWLEKEIISDAVSKYSNQCPHCLSFYIGEPKCGCVVEVAEVQTRDRKIRHTKGNHKVELDGAYPKNWDGI